MSDQFEAVAGTIAYGDQNSSAQTWFAGGERISYDPKARASVAGGDAPFRIFLRQEGDPAQAVSFLPGFPDGSFGWAKVRPHLPNAAEMPKLFLDYVGMGDSDKPHDYAYSTPGPPARSGSSITTIAPFTPVSAPGIPTPLGPPRRRMQNATGSDGPTV